MSTSKRGRKRNDNLPPNRARDVQRAFRARRTAHLQALEQRVGELEDENNYLRASLNLPPSNRPPLGRGPTGKDKPKPPKPISTNSPFTSSRESSSLAESPPSRQCSISPAAAGLIGVSMSPSRPMAVIGDGSSVWDDSMLLTDHSQSSNGQSLQPHDASTYQLTMPDPLTLKPYTSYPISIASSSRQREDVYADQQAHSYTNGSERLSSTYPQQSYAVSGDLREDINRSNHYTQYRSPQTNGYHSQTPLSSAHIGRQLHHPQPTSTHAQILNHDLSGSRESPIPFTTRRPMASTYPLGQSYPQLPNPTNASLPTRSHLPDYMSQRHHLDGAIPLSDNARSLYGPDGRHHGSMT